MAIGLVVTRGYGNGTLVGEIRQVVARGFFSSALTPIQVEQLPNIAAVAATGAHAYDLSDYFTGETSFSIAPAVEAGWTFNTSTGVLTIDTDANGTFGPYTVTATNAEGDTAGNAFTVKVSPPGDVGGYKAFRIALSIH